jgi:hypothetical protein
MIAVKTGEVRQVISASPDYLRRHGTPRTPEDLMTHRSVDFGLLPGNEWTLRTARGTRTVCLRPRLQVNTAEAALDAADRGRRTDAHAVLPAPRLRRRLTPGRSSSRAA